MYGRKGKEQAESDLLGSGEWNENKEESDNLVSSSSLHIGMCLYPIRMRKWGD